MQNAAQIDVAVGERPAPGERFIITLQENSEMLGTLDHGRTFRIVSPSSTERDYQLKSSALTVVDFDGSSANGNEPRLVGLLTYTD
ncbi:hypothetical protein [Acidisoma sp. S159]|uniref:hypothetical protein n=1 Tax=Acidisoma sp. S159 TaxID=1747225 RepID=UPI00131EB55C|nr:hypothetical protein [Acidisoma sp. S159]